MQSSVTYYAECLAQIQQAETLGYQSVWLGEHHLTPDGFPASPLVAAAIAARTSRIRIGTNILPLPLHHPLRVAEDAAAVAVIRRAWTQGRVGFQGTRWHLPDLPLALGQPHTLRAQTPKHEALLPHQGVWSLSRNGGR